VTAPPFTGRLDEADLSLPERPLVSIVIPTLNEERYITQLLESLGAQTYGPENLEVLVADGGSSDRTRELVQTFPSRFARLDVVDNPKRITVSGLNEGMRRAIGHCWVIIGAHSEVEPDFVEQSVSALRRTGAACVGGPIETIGDGLVGSAIAAAMSSPFGVGDAKFRYASEEEEVDTVPFGCYHRKVWELVGEFDETVDGADEDSYNARVIEAGGRIVLVPEIHSSYYPRKTFDALAKQYWEYGAAKGTLLGRGRPLQPRHFIPSAVLAGGPLLILLSRRFKVARWAARALGGLYFSSGFKAAGAVAERHGANTFLTFAAMATMHVTYGAGFIKGALVERLGR
jgi:succinoglycan biosynthesis protein ExoA